MATSDPLLPTVDHPQDCAANGQYPNDAIKVPPHDPLLIERAVIAKSKRANSGTRYIAKPITCNNSTQIR